MEGNVMNQVVAIKQNSSDIMESVIAAGDLSKLPSAERVRYYNEVCRSIGLNPLVQPFSYIVLNGKLTLYATRTCADQLRKINGVSLEIVSRQHADGILTVHVRAKMPDGRCDEDFGSVSFPDTLKGEARANAELKAVTKAKRRATLSICGLGWLDETEIADIPSRAKSEPPKQIAAEPYNIETGEIYDESGPPSVAPALTPEQIETIRQLIVETGSNIALFCKYLRVDRIENIEPARFAFAVDALEAKRKKS
jgi:hypothetical protein